VTSPYDGYYTCSSNVTITGYSSNSNTTVTFYAYNHTDEQWDNVGSTTSSSSAQEFCPEGDMYYFSGTASAGDQDYYTSCGTDECRTFKVYDGSRYITTFESGGTNCMAYRVNELEETCVEAAGECASPNSPEMEIFCPAK
jgi:hypothetical protein